MFPLYDSLTLVSLDHVQHAVDCLEAVSAACLRHVVTGHLIMTMATKRSGTQGYRVLQLGAEWQIEDARYQNLYIQIIPDGVLSHQS